MAERGNEVALEGERFGGFKSGSAEGGRRYAGRVSGEAGASASGAGNGHGLRARLGLRAATALNITDMVGVGPFLTLPLMVAAMGGPPAVLAWVAGGVIAVCDALVWAELAASFPRCGGDVCVSGGDVWAALGTAAGFSVCGAVAGERAVVDGERVHRCGEISGLCGAGAGADDWRRRWGGCGCLGGCMCRWTSRDELVAAVAAVVATVLVYRRVEAVGKLAQWLAAGVLGALGVMIVAGLLHFHPALLRGSRQGHGDGTGCDRRCRRDCCWRSMTSGATTTWRFLARRWSGRRGIFRERCCGRSGL